MVHFTCGESTQLTYKRRREYSILQLDGARILITGASSGIGEALSKLVAKRGAKVILVAEHSIELQRVAGEIMAAGGDAQYELLDLTATERDGVLQRCEKKYGPIDIVVNNAGMGLGAEVVETSDVDLRLVFELNFFALFDLSRQAVRLMSTRKRGVIVNVTSAAARLGSPGISVYSATKGAVHTFSQALRMEAGAAGVQVCECLPVSVRTPFFDSVRGSKYRPGGVVLTPEQVAVAILKAVSCDRVPCEVLPFKPIRLAFIADACFPGLMPALHQLARKRREKALLRDHRV